jgi:hypothetical protein
MRAEAPRARVATTRRPRKVAWDRDSCRDTGTSAERPIICSVYYTRPAGKRVKTVWKCCPLAAKLIGPFINNVVVSMYLWSGNKRDLAGSKWPR